MNNDIQVFSWNISWEAMTGTNTRVSGIQCIINDSNVCLQNVINITKQHILCDFIALQEAEHWNHIFINFNSTHNSVLTEQIINSNSLTTAKLLTFYHKKYILNDKIEGNMHHHEGRPFMILFFDNNKLCVINLHSGHGELKNFDNYVKKSLNSHVNKDQLIKKLAYYDIIMMGDFNEVPHNPHIIFQDPFFIIPGGRKLFGAHNNSTCCNPNIIPDKAYLKTPGDNILYSTPNIILNVLYQTVISSDHAPIKAIIKTEKNIAFNFNLSIQKAKNTNFNLVINQIKPENKNFIINLDAKINDINNFIKINTINNNTVIVSNDIIAELISKEISYYYESNCKIIKLILNKMKKDPNFKFLYRLYYVNLNNDTIQLVLHDYISKN